jgi:predicted dinucleotide-binding enzyme
VSVKAFNAIASRLIVDRDRTFSGLKPTVFHCGDDSQARATAAGLIRDIGLVPVTSGPWAARYLEPLAALSLLLDKASGPDVDIILKPRTRTNRRPTRPSRS